MCEHGLIVERKGMSTKQSVTLIIRLRRLLRLVFCVRASRARVRRRETREDHGANPVRRPLYRVPSRVRVASYPRIPGAIRRIVELAGVLFGEDYNLVLARGTTVMNTEDAARGLVPLRRQDATGVMDFGEAVQRASYIGSRSLSDPRVYVDVTRALGLEPAAVAAAFAGPAARHRREQLTQAHGLGVNSYPTLFLQTKHGAKRLGGPLSSAEALTRLLDEQLADGVA